MNDSAGTGRDRSDPDGLPGQSRSVVSDIRRFVISRPAIPTLVESGSDALREDYEHRIRQRLGLSVSEYAVMNIHKIGVAAPAGYVFEELVDRRAALRCWPGHLATLERVNGDFEHQHVYLLGRKKRFLGLKYDLLGLNVVPLFTMKAIKVQRVPAPSDFDSPRYVLYDCSGGYPVGVFGCFVRSRIADLGELEKRLLADDRLMHQHMVEHRPERVTHVGIRNGGGDGLRDRDPEAAVNNVVYGATRADLIDLITGG